jgi:Nif-specific regulatory protein
MGAQAAVAYKNADAFRKATSEISLLHSTLASGEGFHVFVSESRVMKDLLSMVGQVARTASSVLILGESGVGKELLAEQIHLQSPRARKPFVRVNCAALPSQLLESELFGHVKGAFTDAVSSRKGRFEAANGGTLFLDEVGDIPLEVQAKLLRVLQSRSFERVGSNETLTVDTRIIAATNQDLERMVQEGTFRNDLFYRLNVLPLFVPPLRQRREDIAPLAEFFCKKFSFETKKKFSGFMDDALMALCTYDWPGNIRELENCVERACVLGTPPKIAARDLRLSAPPLAGDLPVQTGAGARISLDRSLKSAINKFKKTYITEILNETSWNRAKTVKILNIQRTYLPRLIRELGIKKAREE